MASFHRTIFMLGFEVHAHLSGAKKDWTDEQVQAWKDFQAATEALADSFTPARIRQQGRFQGSRSLYEGA